MTHSTPETIRRKLIGTLFIAQSSFSAAQIAAFTLMSVIAADLGGADSLAGVPSTVLQVGQSLAAYPVGWMMGVVGRRLGLSLGYLAALGGSLVAVFAISVDSFMWFSVASLFLGMGRGIANLSRFAAADVYEPERRARAISLVVWAGTIGAVAGPLLVAPSVNLAEQLGRKGMNGPFVISALLSLAALILTFIFLRPDPLDIAREEDKLENAEDSLTDTPLRVIFSRRPVQLALASLVVSQFVMTLIMVITPLHMNHGGHGAQAISLVIMAHTLGMFGLSWGTGWLVDRLGPLVMIIVGGVVLAISSLMAPVFSDVLGMALALFLLGLGWNFCFIAGSQMLSIGIATHERGRVQGASETLVGLISGLASLGTGLAFASGGMLVVGSLGLALSLIYVAGTMLGARKGQSKVVIID